MQQRRDLTADIARKFAAEWTIDADTFVRNMEKTIADNADLFPLLSKYYRP